ncbi:MAG: nitroreductase/quinone reductase family protein [Protaetiibacter sp.]
MTTQRPATQTAPATTSAFRPLPSGSYGNKQPTNRGIEGIITRYLVRQARKPRKPGARNGASVLALTTIGAKTGLARTNPVGYGVDGDGWLITASAAGAKNHPAWYYNLAAHPDRAVIEIGGERIPVTATQYEPEEAERKFQEVIRTSSRMARRTLLGYRAATDRVIPIIRLTRR